MNPFALYLASGESLYAGTLLLLLIVCITPLIKKRWPIRLRNLAAWSALALFICACPPFSWIVYTLLLLAFLYWFITANYAFTPHSTLARPLRILSSSLLAIILILLTAIELPHRFTPIISGSHNHLVVIGDSISAGMDQTHLPWPEVFQSTTDIPVKNLALAGIGVEEALTQSQKVTPDDSLILLEIGGNDMLGGLPSSQFEKTLDALLQKLAAPNRTLIMFELPLLPHFIPYGQIQRRLAIRYNVQLIPKRFFTNILADPESTADGLHLSATGTHRMTSLVKNILTPALRGL